MALSRYQFQQKLQTPDHMTSKYFINPHSCVSAPLGKARHVYICIIENMEIMTFHIPNTIQLVSEKSDT